MAVIYVRFLKKKLRLPDSNFRLKNKESLATLSRASGAVYSKLLLREMRILAERFSLYRKRQVSYKAKKNNQYLVVLFLNFQKAYLPLISKSIC